MLNQCQFIGRLGADPEIRTLNSGVRIANIRLACGERWRDKQSGEMKEKTEWVTVVIFNENLVKVVEQYVHKGDLIYISGKMRTRKWQDQSGADRYSTEIVLENFNGTLTMLGSKGDGEGRSSGQGSRASGSGQTGGYSSGQGQQRQSGGFQGDLDDEIPF